MGTMLWICGANAAALVFGIDSTWLSTPMSPTATSPTPTRFVFRVLAAANPDRNHLLLALDEIRNTKST
ncbi:hypothetical protein ACWEQA_18665 [Nocardia sp. NPDC004085]